MRTLRTGSVVHIVAENEQLLRRTASLVERAEGQARMHPSLERYLDPVARHGEEPAAGCCLIVQAGEAGARGLQPLWRSRLPHPVIVIAHPDDVEMAVQVMKDGAFDCLEPPINPVELLNAVSKAIEHDAGNQVRIRRDADVRSRAESLTPREREVMSMLTQGTLNKIIASKLGLSRRTVETHRTNIMVKMNAASMAQLINMSLSLSDPRTCGSLRPRAVHGVATRPPAEQVLA